MELPVYKIDGSQSGESLKLNKKIFGLEPKDYVVHRAVLSYLAAQHQGTHMAKNRALVSGSGKKPYRQKGTGRARAGSVKSNIWRGGGKAFGPTPHGYSVGVNKKEKKLARKLALASKAREDAIMLIEDFTVDNSETKFIADILKSLNISNNDRTLLIIKEHSSSMWNSCKNIKNLSLLPANQICAYDIVKQARLIIQKNALEHINEEF
ncbi:50S ribosomal protein L4 [candidate division KSB1 bacterium]